MKTILIAGGTGFIGAAIQKNLKHKGFKIKVLTRNAVQSHHVQWDGKTLGPWTSHVDGLYGLINLSGKSISSRHNAKNKALILASRLDTTRILGQAVEQCQNPPKLWMNASATGIYPVNTKEAFTEDTSKVGSGFVADVVKQWEQAFAESHCPQTRKVALRTSLVFGNEGGALGPLKTLARFGLGGKQGSGTQKVSWIHLQDYVNAISFIIEHPEISGPVNLCTPQPTTNKKMMAALRKAVGLSVGLPQPAWVLQLGGLLIGTPPSLILDGMNCLPKRLLSANFQYDFPQIEEAMEQLIKT